MLDQELLSKAEADDVRQYLKQLRRITSDISLRIHEE